MRLWEQFSDTDERILRTTVAFVDGRLNEFQVIDWAARLRPDELAKRTAILRSLDRSGNLLQEPWKSAWRFIEEYWAGNIDDRSQSMAVFDAAARLKSGERTGSLVDALVSLVKPGVKVRSIHANAFATRKPRLRAKSVHDLLSLSLTSGGVLDPEEIGINEINEVRFLLELANALDAAVLRGVAAVHRMFGELKTWRLGEIRRVYFLPAASRPEGEHEPDEFHHGIAPAVKLLYAVVRRMCTISSEASLPILRRWRESSMQIHVRMWAAIARDPLAVSNSEVAEFIVSANDDDYWDLHRFPELAELRATRFASLSPHDQERTIRRIRLGPPRSQWPSKADRIRIDEARCLATLTELRRIELGGGVLPAEESTWLVNEVNRFESLQQMSRVDDGFLGTPKAQWVTPRPDAKFDLLEGQARLSALETALTTSQANWTDDPSQRAADWIRAPGNSALLIQDFESAPNIGAEFPHVWDRFGWAHALLDAGQMSSEGLSAQNQVTEPKAVLKLLERLPDGTVSKAIDGISHWLSMLGARVASMPLSKAVWLRLWPLAVKATNAQEVSDDTRSLSVVAEVQGDDEPHDLDTLNTAAGKFVGMFLRMCPNVKNGDAPFDDAGLRAIRDAAMVAEGRTSLIVRHRLIEQLPYFLQADRAWATEYLVRPLVADTPQSVILWRAVGRRTRFKDVLMSIGDEMARRAVDTRLGRRTRQSLVFSLVAEALHSLLEGRLPVVPFHSLQQTFRALDDEVRVSAAGAVQQFVQEMAGRQLDGEPDSSPEGVFQRAAKPFLETVWPQERSLTTPGVAQAFAHLPSACGQAFAEAVSTVERFLVPFVSWSLNDYGFYGEDEHGPKLARIDDADKAAAFLRLLDATIAPIDGGVIPMDLSLALDQIQTVAPRLVDEQAYRRLATVARR
ncbi:MAG: hypothetical protein IV092_01045 [Burkholderiaceae bacterium]|nr:hypothetical protein [Burkholderiaceae bacterium]